MPLRNLSVISYMHTITLKVLKYSEKLPLKINNPD